MIGIKISFLLSSSVSGEIVSSVFPGVRRYLDNYVSPKGHIGNGGLLFRLWQDRAATQDESEIVIPTVIFESLSLSRTRTTIRYIQ